MSDERVEGQLFIFSGPSGSGKDTLLLEFFKVRPDVKLSISSTTRQMRNGEVQGEKYNFVSREDFENGIKNDEFLEYNEYLWNLYGTPKAPVEECLKNGTDMILEVDVNGAMKVMKLMPEAVSVFIMPPSFEELRRRLSGRGTETDEVLRGRLNEAVREIAQAGEYDYIITTNNVKESVIELDAIIRSEKLRIKNKKYLIDEVLSDVKSGNW